MKALAAIILGLAIPLTAAVAVNPPTATSGLSWTAPPLGCGSLAPNSICYSPTALVASGGSGISGSNPYQWTIQTPAGIILATITASGGSATTRFGALDCTGSADNSHCSLSAPGEYPSGGSVTAQASDGSTHSACVMTFIFGSLPAAYMEARARWLGMNNAPETLWSDGGSPPTFQSSNAYFPNQNLPGTWIDFPVMVNTDTGFPACAGSEINRPCISFDGKLFSETDSRSLPGVFGASSLRQFEPLNGGRSQYIYHPLLTGGSWAWDYYHPSWVVAVTNPNGDTQQYDVLEMDNSQADTTVGSFNDPNETGSGVKLFSQATETSLFPVKESNLTQCSNIPDCSIGGGGPEIFTYNLAPCESNLQANCMTLAAQLNINLVVNSGITILGVPHNVATEAGLHDPDLRRGTTDFVWNYGAGGSIGETIFYLIPYNATSASEVTPLYPAQDPTINLNYLSHPTITATGDTIIGGGPPYCSYLQHPSGGSTLCTSSGVNGTVYWDLARQGTCSDSVSFTLGAVPDPSCGLVQFDTTGVGHTTADGFNPSFIGHDNGGADLYQGTSQELFWESQWSPNQVQETLVYPWGNRPVDTQGQSALAFDFGPEQSPDATKYAEAMLDSMTKGGVNYLLPWVYQVRTPAPPVLVSLASTSSAQVQWFPAPLNHEAQLYWVWKQPACSGAWTRLASVNAVYLQATAYSYTDAGLGSGQSACYGLTAQEWSGQESGTLSQQVEITNTAGVFSQAGSKPAGAVNFDTAPAAPTALAASMTAVCATGCLSLDTPAPPTVSAGTGGSLPAGAYSVRITYAKSLNFPINTVWAQTKVSSSVSTTVAANGTLIVDTANNSTMVGQDGYCVQVSGPSDGGAYFQDACAAAPDYANGAPTGAVAFGSRMTITISTHTGTAIPANINTTVGGFSASWTNSASTSTRFHLILYGDGSVPSCSNPWPYEVAAVPATDTSFYFAFPNQVSIAAAVPQYLAIVDVDASGLLSTGTAYNVTTGTGATCN